MAGIGVMPTGRATFRSKGSELRVVLNDLQKQPEEGKAVAPSAKVKIKTHNRVIYTILAPVQWSLNLIGPWFPHL